MHFLHRRGAAAAAVCASLSIAGWSAVAARSVERESRAAEDAGPQRSAVATTPVAAYMVLLRWRTVNGTDSAGVGTLPNGMAVEETLAAHREYWSAQRDSGRVMLTGAVKRDERDAAVIILRAPSRVDAERVAAADPAVLGAVYETEVRALDVQLSRASERPAR